MALTEWATGLFSVNGEEHRRHRKLLSQPFQANRVSGYLDQIFEEIDAQVGRWRHGERLDLHREMMQLTLAIAMRSFFGCDLRGNSRIAIAQARSLRMILSPLVLLAPFDVPGLPYRRFLNSVNEFNVEMRALIKAKRAQGCSGEDVLSRLIRAAGGDEAGMSEGELVGHASVVFAAGHETSSNALTFTFFLLSQHPHVYRALFDELISRIGEGRPSAEELEALPILDRVVRESLRIMPPAPWNARVVNEDVEVGDFALPAETEVIGSIFHTHRLPKIYPNPTQFQPDRWIRGGVDPFEFNPFGGGARHCLGSAFAMMEMKAVIAAVVRRFRVAVVAGSRVDPVVNITMSLRGGLPVTVLKQDERFEASVVPVIGGVHKLVTLPGYAGAVGT